MSCLGRSCDCIVNTSYIAGGILSATNQTVKPFFLHLLPSQAAPVRMLLKGLRHLSTGTQRVCNPTGPPAFVFDIDGVLIRGKVVLQAAVQAMKQLCPGGKWRLPVCFLTNGGGVPEAKKAQQLSTWLGVPVHEQQVILSHTPMRHLAAGRLGQLPVLVCGRGDVMSVAAGYGFKQIMHTSQLAAASPGALPFEDKGHQVTGPAAGECPVRDLGWSTEAHPIAAVLVMSDPAGQHWYQDLQLLTDVITSHGMPARAQPEAGSQPIELYFSNPDLLWAADYSRPRFGQGAFSTALDALHRQVTGRSLPNAHWFGKPNPEPYRLAEELLAQQAVRLGLVDPAAADIPQEENSTASVPSEAATVSRPHAVDRHQASSGSEQGKIDLKQQHLQPHHHQHEQLQVSSSARQIFSAIFAVGDNPAADVRGASQAGPPWVSVLVRTGVFNKGLNSTSDPAHLVVTDVCAAVQAGLHRARTSRWHSMR